jgi:CBS domain-containing protein
MAHGIEPAVGEASFTGGESRMLKIADIMTRDVFTLGASWPADHAALELSLRGFTGAPVRDEGGRLVGVLSRSDLMDPERNEGGLDHKEVQDLMTPAMFTLHPSAPALQAIRLMVREGIHRVIVMDERRDMVGIITATDILNAMARGDLMTSPFASGFSSPPVGAEAAASA